jgi:hypothetical protein
MGNRHDLQLQECPPTPIPLSAWETQFSPAGPQHELIQFCLARQRERIPVTISDVINYLAQKSITADWWWAARFVERHEAELAVQKASVLERSRHEVAPGDVKRHFDGLRAERRSIPSFFIYNVDETQINLPKNSATKCNCRGKHQNKGQ